ncbi:MAG: BCD family MFS transporter [Pseudomonadota bacterium]
MRLSWLSIVRLGLVQMALGAIVVLMTSTLNRLMVVELALAASLPGALVAFHYAVQITRPNWGFLSDTGGRRTAFIIGGMAVLGIGGLLAATAIWVLETLFWAGLALNIVAYLLIGLGVGASGTSLLALLATATDPRRRAAAAMITWLMMIFGIMVSAIAVGQLLQPYSAERLVWIVAGVVSIAFAVTCLAVWGVERRVGYVAARDPSETGFREGLRQVWAEDKARNFTIFVFLSMVAFFMQELILEPYAGLVFGMSPGETTSLSGVQNGGALIGMLTVGIAVSAFRIGTLRNWVIAGCLGSAAALAFIATLGQTPVIPLLPAVVALGFFNGMFAVAAIGAMMALAGQGRERREGTRMGLWGAAQAIAAGFGGLAGASAVDLLRLSALQDASAFGLVFLFEAGLFVLSAAMALRIIENSRQPRAALVPGE